MTGPFICVFLAALLIYLPRGLVIAGVLRLDEPYDNRHPRDQQARLQGWARRAQAAQMNAFEAFPVFAAGVIIAHLAGADPDWSLRLAITFVVARLCYTGAYVADLDRLRSVVWGVGFLSSLGLYGLAWAAS